jgi:hypothetical protein
MNEYFSMQTSVKSLVLKTVVFLVFLITGLLFYNMAFSNYEVSSFPTTGIIYGSYANPNYGTNVNFFEMELNTQNQNVDLIILFAYDIAGNYSLLMTLPYQIDSFQNLRSGNLTVRSTSSGTIVMFTYDIREVNSSIGYTFDSAEAMLHVKGSILDKVFELSTLNLPFGGAITPEISQEFTSLRNVTPFTIFSNGINGTVDISVPYSAIITQTTEPIENRNPVSDFQWIEFSINGFKPFQLQYLDSAQRMNFERNLLISGVVFGVAGSILADIFIDEITAKYQNGKQKSDV